MSGDTSSTEQMFILRTHDGIFDNVGTNNTVQSLADNLFKAFIIITGVVYRQFRGHFNSQALH